MTAMSVDRLLRRLMRVLLRWRRVLSLVASRRDEVFSVTPRHAGIHHRGRHRLAVLVLPVQPRRRRRHRNPVPDFGAR